MTIQQEMRPTISGQLQELLLRWQEMRQQGGCPAADQVCASHPELLEELRGQIRAIQSMEAILGMPAGQDDVAAPLSGPQSLHAERSILFRSPNGDASAAEHVAIQGYEILGLLDRGGMGIVYKARQIGLKRIVALKTILAGPQALPEQLARFRTEVEAVAELRHPNIVQIYEVGEFQGQPYFSMEFIEGGSLAQRLGAGLFPPRAAARLLESLAEALGAAHQRGILHRDLKPANILLQFADRRLENERLHSASCDLQSAIPKITDFGLAKRLHTEPQGEGSPTQTGAILGTASYMAPEQAEGRSRDIGPLADIYALGAILYEMLTARPPFQGESTLDTLEQVRFQDPVPPRRLQPRVPRDLETICLKCLHKEPHQRYLSAGALAEDLNRFLAGEPIRARPTPLWERSRKWARRRPALATLLAVSGMALAGLLGGWIWFTAQLQTSRENALLKEQIATQQQRRAEEERARADALFRRLWSGVQDYVQAVKLGKLEAVLHDDPGSLLYVLARDFARSAEACRKDLKLRPADRDQLAEQYAGRAVELLAKARDFGYFRSPARFAELMKDPTLSSMNMRPDFKKLLRELERPAALGSGR
jgi:serine/threonine protein kinase